MAAPRSLRSLVNASLRCAPLGLYHTNVYQPRGLRTFNALHSDPLQSNIVLISAQRALSPASGALCLIRALCGCAAFLFGSAALRRLLRYLGSYHRQCRAALPPAFGFGRFCFIRLRRAWSPLCSAPFIQLTFIYSPAAGMVAVLYYGLLQGSGGVCYPAVPPPLSGTAFSGFRSAHTRA